MTAGKTDCVLLGYSRRMVDLDPKIDQIVQAMKAEFRPSKIYLFGSRGRGDHREDSDYDLILIDAQSNLPLIDRMIRASRV